MANADWIDELDNKDDDLTYFEQLMKAMYRSRQGRNYWWPIILSKVEDDEMTALDNHMGSSSDANTLTKDRLKREL